MDSLKNNIVVTLLGRMAAWILRGFETIKYEAVPIPSKAGAGDGTGRAEYPHGVLLITAKGSSGATLDKGCIDALAKALRAAECISSGTEIPRGPMKEAYRDKAENVRNIILKEYGYTREGWVNALDSFILAAGPAKGQTTLLVNLDPSSIDVKARLNFSDTENMGKAIKAFPKAVSAEKDENSIYPAGEALSACYKVYLADEGKRAAEKIIQKNTEREARLTQRAAALRAETAKAEQILKAAAK